MYNQHRSTLGGPGVLDAAELRRLCLDCGADDAGFVPLDAVPTEREHALGALPGTRSLISLVFRENRDDIRSPQRSIANLEFHHATDHANETARRVVQALEARGVRAVNPAGGFPMEMDRFPGRIWVIAHKPVAVAAGLGQMGLHRNVIHPRFGSFVLLGTVLVDAEISAYGKPIDFNPCVDCKLCVAACPVGAIGSDGHFDFSSCQTHNYREFTSGFASWVHALADSGSARDYSARVSDSETVSMWQSLAFGPNYKAAYCVAVCPAGEDVIGPFTGDRKEFLERVVRPLQQKLEPVYVVAGSDAERHVKKRFPHKTPRVVRSGLRATSVAGFFRALPLVFQRGAAKDVDVTLHFSLGETQKTVRIERGTLRVSDALDGVADVTVSGDPASWISFIRGEAGIVGLLLRRKLRIRGNPRRLRDFRRCFPS